MAVDKQLTIRQPFVNHSGMPDHPPILVKPTSFTEVAALWGPLAFGTRKSTIQKFAADIGQPWRRVYKMVERNFIDWAYWDAVSMAVKIRFGLILTRHDWFDLARAARPLNRLPRQKAA